MPNSLYADFWENQTSIATHKEFVAFSNKNNKATNHNSREVRKLQFLDHSFIFEGQKQQFWLDFIEKVYFPFCDLFPSV